ncbi:Uncharacterised protein [Burkholderia pseudomallei]|nr:Uncharacterised protein [Burkholderia pseudomallei]VBN01994.1 Uncharacterised protein [Burkholderia pseudomallei]
MHLQRALAVRADIRVDRERVAERPRRIALAARAAEARHERGVARRVELAQVVERHARAGDPRERGARRVVAVVAQHAEAETLVRHRAQRILHAGERRGGRRLHRERHRIVARQPAERAARVEFVEERLAAVPLQLEPARGRARVLAERGDERRDQQLDRLRAVRGVRVGEHFARERRVERLDHDVGVRVGRRRIRAIRPQIVVRRGERRPVRQLARERPGRIAGRARKTRRPFGRARARRPEPHRAALARGAVRGVEIVEQHAPRHAVDDRVVDRQIQLRRAARQHRGERARERAVRQVERGLQRVELRERIRFVARGGGRERQRVERARRGRALPPAAVARRREAFAEYRVVREQRVERAREGVEIERAGDVERDRLIPVAAARNIEREEAQLRGREHRFVAAGGGGIRADGRAMRRAARRRVGLDRHGDARELGERRAVEQLLRRELDAALARARDHLQHENRIAAELEEVVVAADARRLQHVAPDLGERRLDRALRRVLVARRRRRGRRRARAQRRAIDLAVRGHGQRVEHDERGGHHVVGQARGERVAQRIGRDPRAGLGRRERGEAQPPFVLERERFCLRDAGQRAQRGAHLAGLDPVAADLHLVVETPEEIEPAVGAQPHAVARPVDARARHVRVRNEALGARRRAAQIAAREARAAEVQFADRADGHARAVRVEHACVRVRQRPAERHAARRFAGRRRGGRAQVRLRGCGRVAHERADARLGRPIVIDHAAVRLQRGDALDERPRQRLAARDERVRGQHVGRALRVEQRVQMARHDLQHADLARRHLVREAVRIERRLRGQQMQRAARAQRAEQRRVAEVGRDRRHHRHRRVRRERELVEHPGDVVGERAMRHDDALGRARRARRENQIRGLLRLRRHARRGRVRERRVVRACVDVLHRDAVELAERVERACREHPARAARGERRGDPLARRRRIERHRVRARLQHAEERDDEARRTLDADRDGRFRAGRFVARGVAPQRERDAVRRVVELGEREPRVGIRERDAMRMLGRLAREEREHVRRGRERPAGDERARRAGLRNRERGDRAARLAHRVLDERGEAVEPGVRGRLVDPVPRVSSDEFDAARVVGEIERVIEARGRVEARRHPHGRARQRRAALQIELLRELHAQPLVAAPHGGLHSVDHLVERHVLMRERAERGVAHRGDERFERLRGRHARAQRERVEEQADERRGFRPRALRDRRGDDEIALARQAKEPRVERGEQHRKRRRMQPPRGGAHRVRRGGRQTPREPAAAIVALGRARAVERQRERRGRAVERAAPVGELARGLVRIERVALPLRVIRILDRQRRQLGRAAFGECRVGGRQLGERAARAPAVAHRVVRRQQETLRAVGERDEQRAHEWAVGQIERRARMALGQLGKTRGARRAGLAAQVDGGDPHRQRRMDALEDDAVVVLDERRAPRLVARDQHVERALQRAEVERAVDVPVERHVIRGPGVLRAREHPEALLRERSGTLERAGRLGRLGRLTRRARPAHLARRARVDCIGRDRAPRRRPDRGRLPRFALGRIDARGELGERRVVEERVEPQVHAPVEPDRRLQLHRGERIAAAREEAVDAADRRRVVQEPLPERGDAALGVGARRVDIRGGLGRPRRDRVAQRDAVELAVQRVRQLVEAHEPVRQPRGRQMRGHMRAQRVVVRRRIAARVAAGRRFARRGRERDARDQLRAPARRLGEHARVAHARMREQARGDLGRLDAHAAHLHLVVDPAEIVERAVRARAREVARAVDPRAGLARRIRQEALGRQRGAAVIAAREARAAEQQLARFAARDRAVGALDARDAPADRPADRQRRVAVARVERGRRARRDRPEHRRDHGFGRPVAVDEANRGEHATDLVERVLRHRLAAEQQHAQRRRHAFARAHGRELAQVRGRQRRVRHALARDQRVRGVGRERRRIADDDAAADRERHEPRLDRDVEVHRREMQHAIVGPDRQRFGERVAMRGERAVLDDDRLRRARRAGRIDHVRGRARMHVAAVLARRGRVRRGDAADVEAPREARAHRGVGRCVDDAVREPRVARDPVEPRGRMARIERDERAARLHHREQRDEQVARARDAHADRHLRAHARRAQLRGEARGALVEFAARETHGVGRERRERGRVGVESRKRVDSMMQRSRKARHRA